MNNFNILLLSVLFLSSTANAAQEIEIEVPKGWTATADGIVKDNNKLSIGPILDLNELSPVNYLSEVAKMPLEEMESMDVGELKDGEIVAQVVREVANGDSKAKSTLFICKGGRNKHRLLELYTDDVFALISGGKAAISFCSQP